MEPGTPVTTVTITDLETPSSVATGGTFGDLVDSNVDESPIPRKRKPGYFDDEMMTDKKPAAGVLGDKINVDDDDEIPIGEEYLQPLAKAVEEILDDEEDFPLGNVKKPGTGMPVNKKGNMYAGNPVAWMVPNIKIENFAFAHLAALSYGFEINNDPKPGFHNHVLRCLVQAEDIQFFTTKNIGSENIVEMVNRSGQIIAFPIPERTTYKRATAILIFTRFQQTPAKLTALFNGFVTAINNGKWNGSVLKQKVTPLTPEHFLTTSSGIGPYIGQIGCENIIKRFYSDFQSRNRWGKDHRDLLSAFWNPGAWTLDNATFFGAPLSWLTQEERDKYIEQVANRKETSA